MIIEEMDMKDTDKNICFMCGKHIDEKYNGLCKECEAEIKLQHEADEFYRERRKHKEQ